MSRDPCIIDVYERRCTYGNYRTLKGKSLLIWPPCCCCTEQYYRILKERFGFNYVLISGAESGIGALNAGWKTEQMALWFNNGRTNYGTVKYIISRIYQHAFDIEEGTNEEKVAKLKPLNSVVFEEPWNPKGESWWTKNNGFFADIQGCLMDPKTTDYCECVRKIIKDFSANRNDATLMTLIRLAYYVKYEMVATITTVEGKHITIPIRTKTVIDDYVDILYPTFGGNPYVAVKRLNDCLQLIDEVADDSFRTVGIINAAKTGLGKQAWVKARDHDENNRNLLAAANVAGIKQINIIGEDAEYKCNCNLVEPDKCIKFIADLERIFKWLELHMFVEQEYSCSNVLIGTKYCIFKDCRKCRPEIESHWRMRLLGAGGSSDLWWNP